jgi:hypothetical protein
LVIVERAEDLRSGMAETYFAEAIVTGSDQMKPRRNLVLRSSSVSPPHIPYGSFVRSA